MLHTLVPIAFTLFLLFFLVMAGIAGMMLVTAFRLLRKHLNPDKWKSMDRDDLAHRQTVDAVHWTQIQSAPYDLPDHRI
jgi:hypothetical protein